MKQGRWDLWLLYSFDVSFSFARARMGVVFMVDGVLYDLVL